jgi:hypothetical protein
VGTCLHLRGRNHSIDRIISKTYHVLAGPLVLRTAPLEIQNDPLALGSTPFSHSMCIHYTHQSNSSCAFDHTIQLIAWPAPSKTHFAHTLNLKKISLLANKLLRHCAPLELNLVPTNQPLAAPSKNPTSGPTKRATYNHRQKQSKNTTLKSHSNTQKQTTQNLTPETNPADHQEPKPGSNGCTPTPMPKALFARPQNS